MTQGFWGFPGEEEEESSHHVTVWALPRRPLCLSSGIAQCAVLDLNYRVQACPSDPTGLKGCLRQQALRGPMQDVNRTPHKHEFAALLMILGISFPHDFRHLTGL